MKEINKIRGVTTISTTVSRTLWEKAQQFQISWAEALRVGLTTILAQKGDEDYLNPMQLQRKIEQINAKLSEVSQEKNKLAEELQLLRVVQK